MTKPELSESAHKEIRRIARDILFLETLEERGRDRLDFPELHVWSVRSALEAAYQAGMVDRFRR
jgi:hypothetical protein